MIAAVAAGIAGPLVAAMASWLAAERTWRRDPARLTGVMIAHQLTGWNTPLASITWPCGVCIQLLAEMIQNVEISVPSATMQVAKKWSFGGTRFQPNSITPRNVASRKKAVSTS